MERECQRSDRHRLAGDDPARLPGFSGIPAQLLFSDRAPMAMLRTKNEPRAIMGIPWNGRQLFTQEMPMAPEIKWLIERACPGNNSVPIATLAEVAWLAKTGEKIYDFRI